MRKQAMLAMAFLTVVSAAPARAQPGAAVDGIFAALSAERPGLSVLVARHGKVVFQRTAGAADVEQRTAITARTRFHVASVSKQFTAAAVLLLARDGRLSLDAPARRYLPSLPEALAAVTVRQLLNHTSGLRDQWDLAEASGASISDLLSQDRLLALIQAQRSLNFKPGSEFRYSNSGYLLAAEIVARVAGMPFARFLEERLFRPLGMEDTLVYDDATIPIPDRAQSYGMDAAGRVRLSRLNFSNYGATSVFTTAADLHRWSRELLKPRILDASIPTEMARTTPLPDGSVSPYGLGLNRQIVRGHAAIMHTGSDAGFRALLAVYPREDATVVILSNGSDDVAALNETLVTAFLDDGRTKTTIAPPSPARLAELSGYYVSRWGPGFELQMKDGAIVRRVADGPLQGATFHADGTMRFQAPALRLRSMGAGVLRDNPVIGPPLDYRRVVRTSPASEALAAATGRYRSPELDATMTVAMEDGGLVIYSQRTPRLRRLVPAEDGWFDLPWARVRFPPGRGGKAAAMILEMSRSHDIRFDRVP